MTVYHYIKKYADADPKKVAVIYGQRKITYKMIHKMIQFHRKNSQMESCVILKLEDQAEFLVALLVYLACGTWVVPVSTKVSVYELEEICKITNTNVIIENVKSLFDISDTEEMEIKEFPENYGGIYHMTSGTTGKPKFAVRTLESLTYEGESYKETFSICPEDKILNIPALYHSFSLGAVCFGGFISGATVYLFPDFYPRKVLNMIETEKINILILVPVMAKILSRIGMKRKYDFSSVRVALVGAGKIDKELYDGFYQVFQIYLMSNYGSTETGALFSRLTKEPYASIGKPMEGVQYKIIKEQGEKAEKKEIGELYVKTKGMALRYLNGEILDMDDQGYLNMHDMCMEDQDGNVEILYRTKQIANIGGRKVSLAEVEEIVKTHEKVKDCVAFCYKKKNKEEGIQIIIKTTDLNVSRQEIREFCMQYLSPHKVPSKIFITDKSLRNEIGKVSKKEIEKIVQEFDRN